jgi:uncharacterized protein YndB with AHSA1/START domain
MPSYSEVGAPSVGSERLALHLQRVIHAPPETVFAACIEPERLAEWWGPAGFTTGAIELDVREDGPYRITMQPPDADAFHLRGRFIEVDPPRRLSYTFEWEEPDPDDRKTTVTLTFLDHPEGTKLRLDQGPFATDSRLALHTAGWTETLARLERFLTCR